MRGRGQQKQRLTLENIFSTLAFRAAAVPGFDRMQNGRYYAALENGALVQHELATGKALQTLVPAEAVRPPGATWPLDVDGYHFNADKKTRR